MKKVITLACCLLLDYTYAYEVDQIVFEGLDRVEEAAMNDCLTIKPNVSFDDNDIDATVKALFKKGFFSDVKLLNKDRKLVIKCVEKPIVDRVAFEGNEAAADDVLKNVIGSRLGEGRLFSLYLIKDILADFQMVYRALGFYSAVVVPKLIKRPGNKVDVVFEIKEGSKTTVKKIIFVGNKSFSDDELKDVMSTKEEKMWRFWDYDSHVFREDKVEVDLDAITTFYKNRGYPFFMVTSSSAEMDFDKKSHRCTFTIEEGDKYNISDVTLTSAVEKIKADEFKEYIIIEKDDVYNESKIKGNRNILLRKIALLDNPFIDVEVKPKFDKEKKLVSINYNIVERPKAFVEKIDIVGNTKTLDRVIRREFSVHEGDALNRYKIEKTIEKLKGVGYFDGVETSVEDGSADDKKVLMVSVKEKESTAAINFGLNVSDSDGFGGFTSFVEHNLFGTGRELSAEVSWMQRYYGGKVGIFDPRFMDQNFGAGIRVGGDSYKRKDVNHSTNKTLYINPYVSYRIMDNLSHIIGYRLSTNKRGIMGRHLDLDDEKSKKTHRSPHLLDMEKGRYSCGEITSTLTYAKSLYQHTIIDSYELTMRNSYAGGICSVSYFKNELGAKFYKGITEKVTFIVDANVGHIKEIKNTRSHHRFSLGGDGQSMRGFDSGGVGPRERWGGNDEHHDDRDDADSMGGTKYWTVSLMAKAPLSTKEMGINGVLFLDFGSAWGRGRKFKKKDGKDDEYEYSSDTYTEKEVDDSSAVRVSAGVAIEWARSPLGVPLSFVFGFPIRKKGFDRKQTFTLTGVM
ncbi:outer membrane protein assembly factor BamA [Alphaproteobacteria bacterium]|nr:outer membrane protein assembly factor BamA [Alphaproteobacteria bacterium]